MSKNAQFQNNLTMLQGDLLNKAKRKPVDTLVDPEPVIKAEEAFDKSSAVPATEMIERILSETVNAEKPRQRESIKKKIGRPKEHSEEQAIITVKTDKVIKDMAVQMMHEKRMNMVSYISYLISNDYNHSR